MTFLAQQIRRIQHAVWYCTQAQAVIFCSLANAACAIKLWRCIKRALATSISLRSCSSGSWSELSKIRAIVDGFQANH